MYVRSSFGEDRTVLCINVIGYIEPRRRRKKEKKKGAFPKKRGGKKEEEGKGKKKRDTDRSSL